MDNARGREELDDTNSEETESKATNHPSNNQKEEARIEAATHRFIHESKLKL
jgi:hypothetical protein